MGLFSLFGSKDDAEKYFDKEQVNAIVEAVRSAERQTSGEVRVFIETRCRYVDAMYRAAELFFGLKMDLTDHRNAVLVYVAIRDHQFSIFADEGVYRELGKTYWEEEAAKMVSEFKLAHYADGIIKVVNDIGEALKAHFPYDQKGDKNELPDDIIFGS